MQPLLWLLKHPQSNSVFAVEYGRIENRLARVSQGFIQGNVVDLNTYRTIKKMATNIFG